MAQAMNAAKAFLGRSRVQAGPGARAVAARAAQTDVLTTDSGMPIANNTSSLTVGPRGPVLLEDFHMIDKISKMSREKIPERVVHARGAAAFGEFKVTGDISDVTDMDLFSAVGNTVPVQARFSTVVHPRGSPEALRDVRGFTVRFQTEQGNWDLVGNNAPVFFIRDGISFPDLVHALKPNPQTHSQEWWRILDWASFHPESAHALTWLLDDVGIPKDYRHMNGFGVHTFKLIKDGAAKYVKFHWITDQGEANLTDDEAITVGGTNQAHATTDLFESIKAGEFPSWTFKVQIMDIEDETKLKYDPLDATKVWPEEDYPLKEVGKMTLNSNVNNFFTDNEQMAFSPSNIVPGITFSNDKLLQSRLFSYADAQRYRLGVNYNQLPINVPKCPFHANQYDGAGQQHTTDEQIDYYPSTFRKEEHVAEEPVSPNNEHLEGERMKVDIEQDDYYFPGKRYREFDAERQDRMAMRIAMKMTSKNVTEEIQGKWMDIWTKCDEGLAGRIEGHMKEMMA